MTVWQFLTTSIPLTDERDVMARIGQRFLLCTGPYALIAVGLSKIGYEGLLDSWMDLFLMLIPFLGGAVDWARLKRLREAARASGAS